MAGEWKMRPLGELTINHDSKRKPVREADRKPGPYPYYGASGIVDYVADYLIDGDFLLIAEDGENLRTRQTPIAFMARGKSWVNNHAHIVTGNDKADTRFLMYALKATDVSGYLTGAVMPKLTQGSLNRIEIPCPGLDEQRAIAHALGTFDDKIELNRRMNETLEAIARAIFKSWFVDFDPVRAKASGEAPDSICRRLGLTPELLALFPDRLVDSELGEIPEGWPVCSLCDLIDILDSKRVPLSNREREKRRGPYPYYGAASVMDYIDDFLFEGVHVLMGEDGSVTNINGTPVLQYVWGKFWVNNHAHVLRTCSSVSNEQLLLFLRQTNIASLVTGAVQAKLNQGNLKRIEFIRAPDPINKSFDGLVGPMFGLIRSRTEESRTLSDLRDALLPELLSGKVRASHAGVV